LEPSKSARAVPWPHAPLHRLSAKGTYFLTAGTYRKEHFFRGANRLQVLHRGLLTVTQKYGWTLEAWAVFSNHYHFVGHSPELDDSAESLSQMLGLLHEKTAKWINRLDASQGRQVWHNFWDTRLTYEKSYLARINYVHQNPVKHGLVAVANKYPWCSAGWFERNAQPAQVKTIYGFKLDKLKVYDEYEAAPDW
jgi:putative transposase